jgi:hypothetical protein
MNNETNWDETPEGFIDYVLPEHWACALINGDESGMEQSDIDEMDRFLGREMPGSCVDMSDSWFAHRNDATSLGGDVATFRFQLI